MCDHCSAHHIDVTAPSQVTPQLILEKMELPERVGLWLEGFAAHETNDLLADKVRLLRAALEGIRGDLAKLIR